MQDIVIKSASRIPRKKSKRPDKRPARLRYWMKRTLEERKIRHLMKYCGMTRQQAYRFWHNGSLAKGKEGRGRRLGRAKSGTLAKVA